MDDIERATELLTDIEKGTSDACQHIQSLLDKAEKGEISTSKGLSFLEMKYQMLLSYLINLTYVLLQKTRGQSIQADLAIFRLTEIRTVLEKLRPIDQKLKYQIDKLIRTAVTGDSGSNDPLRFKANPDNMINKLEGEASDEESNSDEEKERKPRVYVPPKLAAVHYDGDETMEDKKQRQQEKAQRRAASSSVVRELAHQLTDAPEEIQETRDLHRMKVDKRAKEIKEYEEQYFTRVSVSKKERNAARRLGTTSSLNSLTQFDDISALMGDGGDTHQDGPSRKKQKTGGKGKGKKGKKGGFKKKKRKF
ncbi:neuroguidin-like [Mizuhopecten yessoensis]|uniref:Neuroguidin n=1 Tax=Mizuhopecten yessoensis TaxID=6573 RepID=A0A210PLL7_MIZYE|nr:neuroguidin-like [Mizuhopecten yessoensis]XP_021380374.1 neuroguidin-like [Mizuhopecten yessoensis]OWF37389.1 Neuroguidin [Mizuhopecten yessoensis]